MTYQCENGSFQTQYSYYILDASTEISKLFPYNLLSL